MSSYHKNCKNSDQPQKGKPKKQQSRKSLNAVEPLTTKPFCDCEYCECKACPDILKMLAITVTGNTCIFGAKPRASDVTYQTNLIPQRASILDALNRDDSCDCEMMARAIRSNIHMNLGLSEQRGKTEQRKDSQSSANRHNDNVSPK